MGGGFWADPSIIGGCDGAEPLVLEGWEAAVRAGAAAALDLYARLGVGIERIVVSEGVVEHELGARHWRETSHRVHLSLAQGSHRALLDLAGFDEELVADVARALASLEGERVVSSVRLAPNVTAALLPSLVDVLAMEQMPADHDGYGEPVLRHAVVNGELPPNWYRPSYRIRPVRAWHNLRVRPFGVLDNEAPQALALLAPPEKGLLRLLCRHGGAAFAATLSVAPIRAVGESGGWDP